MKLLAPLSLVLLASCVTPRPAPAGPNPGPEIIAAVELMYDDLSARRWDALEAHFLPDATILFSTPKGPNRKTLSEFIEVVRKNVEGKEIFDERMIKGAVWAHQDVASVWSTFEGREGSAKELREWAGVDAFTLVKVEGRWRISHVAVSIDPAAPPK